MAHSPQNVQKLGCSRPQITFQTGNGLCAKRHVDVKNTPSEYLRPAGQGVRDCQTQDCQRRSVWATRGESQLKWELLRTALELSLRSEGIERMGSHRSFLITSPVTRRRGRVGRSRSDVDDTASVRQVSPPTISGNPTDQRCFRLICSSSHGRRGSAVCGCEGCGAIRLSGEICKEAGSGQTMLGKSCSLPPLELQAGSRTCELFGGAAWMMACCPHMP